MIDVLGDVLDTVALKGTLYFHTDFFSPFAIAVPAYGQAARFHFIVRGRCHIELPGGEHVLAQEGDLVLVPYGSPHVLSDAAGRPAASLEDVLSQAGYTGQGVLVVGSGDPAAATQMVCGHFNFADGADHPLLRALPPLLVIAAAVQANHPILQDVLRLLAQRMFEDAPGSASAVTRLSEVLYIEALRASAEAAPELNRLLQAVNDPHIGQALALIHRKFDHPWSLDEIASKIGMSRTRFAERFRQQVGCGPMTYLADWRLQRARALLDAGLISVQQVAHRTGYRSPGAFSRAFAQKFGKAPQAMKRGPSRA